LAGHSWLDSGLDSWLDTLGWTQDWTLGWIRHSLNSRLGNPCSFRGYQWPTRHIVGGQRPVDDSFPAEGTATRATFVGISSPRDISWVDSGRSTTLSRRRARQLARLLRVSAAHATYRGWTAAGRRLFPGGGLFTPPYEYALRACSAHPALKSRLVMPDLVAV